MQPNQCNFKTFATINFLTKLYSINLNQHKTLTKPNMDPMVQFRFQLNNFKSLLLSQVVSTVDPVNKRL